MDARGYAVCTPEPPHESVPREPFLNLQSGYVLRSVGELPKQAAERPWRLQQSYLRDIPLMRRGPLDDAMRFERAPSRHEVAAALAEVPA
jgi:hypothetical protein